MSSGLCVSLASAAANRGRVPMPVARISPLPRHASAAAAIASSAREKDTASVIGASQHRKRQDANALRAAAPIQVASLTWPDEVTHVTLPANDRTSRGDTGTEG